MKTHGTVTRIVIDVPTDDSYWTSDPDERPRLANAQTNWMLVCRAYLEREYPGVEVRVTCSANGDRGRVETDDDADDRQALAADLMDDINARMEWSDEELWDTDPEAFDPAAYVARKLNPASA